MEKRGNSNFEKKMSSIVKENRQLSVRIPAEFVSKLRINPKEDKFMWVVVDDNNGLSLHGQVIKYIKNDKENN